MGGVIGGGLVEGTETVRRAWQRKDFGEGQAGSA